MAWTKRTTIQRSQAWATTGLYRELARRLPRCGGSRRRLEALAERQAASGPVLLGALPSWPYSAGWGYYPSGGLGLVLVVLLILVLVGRI